MVWPVLNSKLFLLALILCLSACDNDEPQRARIIPIQTGVDDPAMNGTVVAGLAQHQTEKVQADAEKKENLKPQEFTVDLKRKRVFFPDQGWLNAQEFWTIYYEQPEKLPADIDFELLEKFKQATRTLESDS